MDPLKMIFHIFLRLKDYEIMDKGSWQQFNHNQCHSGCHNYMATKKNYKYGKF